MGVSYMRRLFLVTGLLWVLVAAGRQVSADTPDFEPRTSPGGDPVRVCICPFAPDVVVGTSRGKDLAFLLQVYLEQQEGIECVPVKEVYGTFWDMDPLFVRSDLSTGQSENTGAVYLQLRERLFKRISLRYPSDYFIQARVIRTGQRWSFPLEVLCSALPRRVVFTTVQETESAEEIPQALQGLAEEIGKFVRQGQAREDMAQIQKQYLAQVYPLATAVEKALDLVNRDPDRLCLRVWLLSFYMDDPQAYEARIGTEAGAIARSLDPGDEEAKQLFGRLAVNPFTVLCREKARKHDWPGVLEACDLGMIKYPLHSTEYKKWRTRAYQGEGKLALALQAVEALLRELPRDEQLLRQRRQISELIQMEDLGNKGPNP